MKHTRNAARINLLLLLFAGGLLAGIIMVTSGAGAETAISAEEGGTSIMYMPLVVDTSPRACPEAHHDPTAWHPLFDSDANCFHDHEHKHDPNQVNHIFGPPGAWFGGGELSYPWQTHVGADGNYSQWSGDPNDLESVAKHNMYGWIVRTDIPRHNRTVWITDFRLQFHGTGAPMGVVTRFHSYSLEARVCGSGGQCGIVRTGGWIDYGNLELRKAGQIYVVPLAGEEEAVNDTGRRRVHYTVPDLVEWRRSDRKNEFFWYGRQRPMQPPYNDVVLHPVSVHLSTADSWTSVDPADPTNPVVICPAGDCNKNNSTIQAHSLSFTIPAGFSNYSGYADRYGRAATGCTAPGLDCIPLVIENGPTGTYQHRDDRDLGLDTGGVQDFDTSPAGISWIKMPN